MSNIPIDWAGVNWPYVILLGLFAFFCALIGNVIAFKRAVSFDARSPIADTLNFRHVLQSSHTAAAGHWL
jgi:hypothetical protein